MEKDCFLNNSEFEEKYDMRAKHWVNPRVVQKALNCWAYTARAVLESHLLMKGVIEYETYLSAGHITYAMFDMAPDDPDCVNINGRIATTGDYGGGRAMAVAYMTRNWSNVYENIDPSFSPKKEGRLTKRAYDITTGKPSNYMVTEVQYFNPKGESYPSEMYLNWVKNAVKNHSAVGMVFNSGEAYFTQQYHCSYCNSNAVHDHHATIIGWDDNFDRNNFQKELKPRNNGAFLVLDSFPRYKEYDGYMWISYEDASIADMYFISGVDENFYIKPREVLQHDIFGFQIGYNKLKEKSPYFSCRYSARKGDRLEAIAFYIVSPCLIDAVCISAGKTIQITSNHNYDVPGYYTLYCDIPIELQEGSFEIKLTLSSDDYDSLKIPIEYISDISYNNILMHIEPNQCFIEGVDITEIRKRDSKYGNVPLRAIVYHEGAETLEKAYNSFKELPEVTGNCIYGLPQEYNGVTMEWRVEPHKVDTYSGVVRKLKLYEYKKDGQVYNCLMNIDKEKAKNATLTALFKSEELVMKRTYAALLYMQKGELDFETTDVKVYGNKTTIKNKGTFIKNAYVVAEANDRQVKVAIKDDYSWEITDFHLYQDGTWKDKYEKTTLKISVVDEKGTELASKTKEFELKKPYTSDGNGTYYALGFLGLLALIAAGTYIAHLVLCETIEEEALIDVPLEEMADIGTMESENPENPCCIRFKAGLFKSFKTIKNVICKVTKIDKTNKADQNADVTGLIAREIQSGGEIINCRVEGSYSSSGTFGAFFGKGENVTVKDCTVAVDVDSCTGTYCGIGVNLTGECTIDNVTICGKVQSKGFHEIAQSYETIDVMDLKLES